MVDDIAEKVAICLEVVLDLGPCRGQPPDHAVWRWGVGCSQLLACAYCLEEETIDDSVCLHVDAVGRVVDCGQKEVA